MTNEKENFSNEEQKAIDTLRNHMKKELEESLPEDEIPLKLYKFLKARDFDIDKAEIMLRKNLAWRKANQVDTILKTFKPKEFFNKYPRSSFVGLDKDGDIVEYNPSGKLEGKDILRCFKMNDYMKHWVWHAENNWNKMRELKEKTGRVTNQVTVICDLDKLTLANASSKHSAELCLRLMHILQDNYPEWLKTMYIINAPAYYVFVFSILKTIMSRAMIQKIHVYGHSGWKEKLLEVIEADVLPAFLGGNRTDPDGNPMCNTFIAHGGKFPEKYYLSESERDFKNKSLVRKVQVPQNAKKEIFVDVPDSGFVINWEFLVKNKDIGFGLFKSAELKLEEILPLQRIDTIDGTEEGSYKCSSAGKYVVVFDNSYSWMNSKEVEYCITVKPEL